MTKVAPDVADAAAMIVEALQRGQKPAHLHTCSKDPKGLHRWPCTSPYCLELDRDCEHHGGATPLTTEDILRGQRG